MAIRILELIENIVKDWTRPPLVMVTEDNPRDAEMMVNALHDQGCRTILCRNVLESLSSIKSWTPNDRPQVVFLDLALPDGDIADIIKAVRNVSKGIAIAIVTGCPDTQSLQRAMNKGVCSIINKPLTPNGLEELFATHSVCTPA